MQERGHIQSTLSAQNVQALARYFSLGSPLSVLGTANLGVGLGDITVRSDFLVAAGLSSKAIIGLDFLEKHEAVINLGQGVLHLKGRAIPLGKTSHINALGVNSINLKINETIQLPAMSGMDIILQAPPLNVTEQYWLFEAMHTTRNFFYCGKRCGDTLEI